MLPLRPQHGLAVAAQPAVEQGCIDAAEIGVELEIVGVQVREAWMLAHDTRLDGGTSQKEARACAVVGAAAAVFLHAAAEFGVGHQPHAAVIAARLERLEKPVD